MVHLYYMCLPYTSIWIRLQRNSLKSTVPLNAKHLVCVCGGGGGGGSPKDSLHKITDPIFWEK